MDTEETLNYEIEKLDGITALQQLLCVDLKQIVYTTGAPYLKFLLIVNAIEFLGAHFDSLPYEKPKQSEDRFNDALKKLFNNKYLKYSKSGADIYFYEDLRCGLVHQFRPTKSEIHLTTRIEAKQQEHFHLQEEKGHIYLVLEDFYDDLEKAAENFIKKANAGATPSSKHKETFINVYKTSEGGASTGATPYNTSKEV